LHPIEDEIVPKAQNWPAHDDDYFHKERDR